jgi:hypothetical protein
MRRIKNEYINAVLVAQNGTGQLAIQTLSRCVDASQKDDDRQSSPTLTDDLERHCYFNESVDVTHSLTPLL